MKRSVALVLLVLVVAALALGAPATAAPATITLTADQTTATAFPGDNSWTTLHITVTDELGAPVSEAEVSVAVTDNQSGIGDGAVSLINARTAERVVTTDDEGKADVVYYAGAKPGTDTVTVTTGSLSASVQITVCDAAGLTCA